MINYNELEKEEKTIDDFFVSAYLYNLKRANPMHVKTSCNNYYQCMNILSQFGVLICNYRYKIEIYKQIVEDYNRALTIYYAIDKTGLVIGHIFGPTSEKMLSKGTYSEAYYFGDNMNKLTNTYDCVDIMNSNETNELASINLENFRETYLPLNPRDFLYAGNWNHYESSNEYDYDYYGPIIWRSNKRSFYLPFLELIRNKLNLSIVNIKVKPKFEIDCISFTAIYYYKTRRSDNSKTWIGKINYDKFEIIEIFLINETSEYNG
ncbi:MAG: hypothetical protein IPK03_14145 [Bacteroidetes bacterium]|nr:hypothetical protein [Bacteroidota bacterium]